MRVSKTISGALALNSSLGRSLAFFIGILLLASVATSIWTLTRSWERTVHEAERSAINLSISQSRQAEDTFLQAELAIMDIRRTASSLDLTHLDQPATNRYLKEIQDRLPQLHGLLLYDAQGNMQATSFNKMPAITNNSDREYFIYHRQNGHSGVHISDVIRSRSTGELVIPVSVRINDAGGGFAGVALATIKVDYFRHFYNYFEMGDRDTLSLLKTDGTALYIRPFPEDIINRNFSSSPLFTQALMTQDRGYATWVSVADKVERIFGFARLERYPLVVAAGYDKTALWENWLRDSLPDMILNAMLLLGILLMGAIVFRQVRMNVRNQTELTVLRDELTSINHTLQLMALADGLTGLANRRQFDLFLENSLKASRTSGKPVALIMIDVDHFKRYNDFYGHVAGDNCLRQVGALLHKLTLHTNALAARYGGEEFALVLPETDENEAFMFAQSAVQLVRDAQIPHAESGMGKITLTISAGCFCMISDGNRDDVMRIKESADKALYLAKQQGRDRAVIEKA